MTTSLYRHYDKAGNLLYIGISLSAVQRLGQHAEHSHWFALISKVTIEHFENRESALAAERAAIIEERPLHNIHHKYGAEQAKLEAQEALTKIAQARKDLTARVVYFSPVYSLHQAADALSVNIRHVNQWVREGKLGYFTMPSKTGKPVQYISGWQLIDYIENVVK